MWNLIIQLSQALGLETKVTAGSLGALLGGALSGLLERFVFHGTIPGVLAEVITWGAPLVAALILAYLAPHTHRPDLVVPAAPEPAAAPPPPASGGA
jgi:hypothetical protein